MSPSFVSVLKCVQIRIFSSVMLETYSTLDGIKCFVPIYCLPESKKKIVEKIITQGLGTMLKRAETKKWNGKRAISSRKQNIIDPYLSALYNIYSLSACLTDPYLDSSIPSPDRVKFTINVSYIPEGENDSCRLEIILHSLLDVFIFAWKEFSKENTFVFLRRSKVTWILNTTNGNSYDIEYNVKENRMGTCEGELERRIGWPRERMDIAEMIDEAIARKESNTTQLNRKTYKWIKRVPHLYLKSMELNLDEKKDGLSLLHVLADLDDVKRTACIIDKINDLDPVDPIGQTPLHRACLNSSFKVAKLLIESGANVNAVTDNLESPLTILAKMKQQDMQLIRMLLRHNARRQHENGEHMRAVDILRMTGQRKELIELLKPV